MTLHYLPLSAVCFLVLLALVGCGGSKAATATKQYWDAHRSLNLSLEDSMQTEEPKSVEDFLASLDQADQTLGLFISKSNAISTDNVDPEVVAYIADIHRNFASARLNLRRASAKLSELQAHNYKSLSLFANFNYTAETLFNYLNGTWETSESLDRNAETAKRLESEFRDIFEEIEAGKAVVAALNGEEIRLRNLMKTRHGITLKAFDDRTGWNG